MTNIRLCRRGEQAALFVSGFRQLLLPGVCCLVLASWTRAGVVQESPFLGVEHIHISTTTPRLLDMHIVQIDLTAPGIGFAITPSNGAAAGETVGQTTRQFLTQQNAQIAVNGSFSRWVSGSNYDVEGLAVTQGSVYSEFDASINRTTALNISTDNVATIIRSTTGTGTAHTPGVELYNALGGEARLLDNGNNVAPTTAPALVLHPRSAVGVNEDQTRLFLFTVDGRNPGHSLGMTLPEVADVMRQYGAHDAINLDGGGSTTLAFADIEPRVVNVPVGVNNVPGTERVVGSNFAVFAQAPISTPDYTLFASNGTTGNGFGGDVAIDGDYAIVGAVGSGSAYMYEYNGNYWIEKAQLRPSVGSPDFGTGSAVHISGDTAVIGSPGALTTGIASVFQRDDGGAWNEVATLLPSDGGDGAQFGYDVSIDGDNIIVGARQSSTSAYKAGAAYVYSRDYGGEDTWGQVAKLPTQTDTYGRFGHSVDIDGDIIVVGTARWNGSAFIYYADGSGGWNTSPATQIIHSGGDKDLSVSIDGTRVVIAQPDNGTASIWDRDGGGVWQQIAGLDSPNSGGTDRFGEEVAVQGDKVIVGASAAGSSGEAYIFELAEGGSWVQRNTLTTTSPNTEDGVGTAVALTKDFAILGGPFVDGTTADVGAAYIYSLSIDGGGGLQGDLNGDGIVSSADLDLVRANWGTSNSAGDASRDGFVNSSDLDIVRANWGVQIGSAVPEPGTFAVLGALGLLASAIRRRQAAR